MAQSLKVLVTGPIVSLEAYATKLAQLQTKHSFSLVVAQDLFSRLDPQAADEQVDKLINGDYKLPVQVYATYGNGYLPEKVKAKVEKGEEVCPNLNVLREYQLDGAGHSLDRLPRLTLFSTDAAQAGVLSLASGLRIATLAGVAPDSATAESGSDGAPFTASQVSDLIASLSPAPQPANSALPPPAAPKPVDLLLTHLCPSSLPLLSAKPLTPPESRGPDAVYSNELDEVARVARAKYHFVAAPGVFWEREPFEWPVQEGDAPQKTYCRALSLGEMGNKTKDRVSRRPVGASGFSAVLVESVRSDSNL